MASPWRWFVIGWAISIGITGLLWALQVPGFWLFLLLPMIFPAIPLASRPRPRCPTCHRELAPGDRYCPSDGSKAVGADEGDR